MRDYAVRAGKQKKRVEWNFRKGSKNLELNSDRKNFFSGRKLDELSFKAFSNIEIL